MAAVELRGVTKTFEGATPALDELTLRISDGEFMVLVGPSGCGKSTALRIIAGLERPERGEVWIGGNRVDDWTPQRRNVAMVFQNYALYPHMTVRRILEFPLRMSGLGKEQRRERAERIAAMLGLGSYLQRRPAELSGGQRQRVAMGRALVRDPSVFLMDEPLSNLDAKLRVELRGEIAALQRRAGVTTIYVTHDQAEAMTLGDRVAVMDNGVLQQVDRPQVLYERPANTFVAGFIGSPAMNIVRARVVHEGQSYQAELVGEPIRLPLERIEQREALTSAVGMEVIVGMRPEAFALQRNASDHADVEGDVTGVERLGHESIVTVSLGAGREQRQPASGFRLVVRVPLTNVQAGEHLRLRLDSEKVHIFDGAGQRL